MGRRMVRRTKRNTEQQRGYTGAWYDHRKSEVCLKFWESPDATEPTVERIQYDWYFSLSISDWDDIQGSRQARKLFDGLLDRYDPGSDYVKLFMPYYGNRHDEMTRKDLIDWLRERGIEPLEADVDPVTRFMSDNPIGFAPPRVLWFDLENVPLGWVPDGRGGRVPHERSRILSVAWGWSGEGATGYAVNQADPNIMHEEFEKLQGHGCAGGRAEKKLLDEAEADCLREFFRDVGKADLVVAWNGDGHDEPLLKSRCKALGLRPFWKMVQFLDYMALFKHPYYGFGRDTENKGVKVSYKLDSIAQAILGDGKVEGVPGTKMLEIWDERKELLKRYNKQDVDIMIRLEAAKGYLGAFTQIAHVHNRFPSSRSLMAGYTGEGLLLRYGAENGIRFPTKQTVEDGDDHEDNKKIGAFVLEPSIGLHDDVVGIDFGSLYPNVALTFNISPDTRLGMAEDLQASSTAMTCEAPNGAVFDTSRKGAVPAIVEHTMAMRKKYRDRFHELEDQGDDSSEEYKRNKNRSDGWKVAGNGLIGLLGSPYSRIYDPQCFEAVTTTGRVAWGLTVMGTTKDQKQRRGIYEQLLELPSGKKLPGRAQQTIERIVDEQKAVADLQVIAGDTDSAYLRCSETAAKGYIEKAAELTDAWVESRGGSPGYIRLDVDAVFLRVLWVAKKRYVARRKGSDVPYVKGLEWARTDGCKAQRALQEDVFRYLLWETTPTPEGAERIIRAWAFKLSNGGIPIEDLVLTVGLSRDVEEYKADTPPIQARVAKQMIEAGREVYPGMKIPYVIVNAPKEGPKEAMHVDECGGRYDSEHYWTHKLYPAARRLLDSAFSTREKLWKRLGKMQIHEKQRDMFDKPLSAGIQLPGKLAFRFRPGDEGKFDQIKAVFDSWPGAVSVEMTLQTEQGEVVAHAGQTVQACNELVDQIEGIMGRRVYYGGLLPDAKENPNADVRRKKYQKPAVVSKPNA